MTTHAPLRILTWHIHGNYLYYLTHGLGPETLPGMRYEVYVPVKPGRPPGYAGRAPGFPWGDHVFEIPVERVRQVPFDCILFQSRQHFLVDQYAVLSEDQRHLPRLYLEHDPPREHPTDTCHPVDDPDVLLVHVTHFNELMWNNRNTPTRVIEHGVVIPDDVRYTGELPRGVVVINMLGPRGRRLGADLFERVRRTIPLDLIGMGAEQLGGSGEVPHDELPGFLSRYRFLFNPIRYTSLGLSVCEAMMLGLPVVGLATTEMVTVVENGMSGYLHTDWRQLVDCMRTLLHEPERAQGLSEGARRMAQHRFNIHRFGHDWDHAIRWVIERGNLMRHAVAMEAGS